MNRNRKFFVLFPFNFIRTIYLLKYIEKCWKKDDQQNNTAYYRFMSITLFSLFIFSYRLDKLFVIEFYISPIKNITFYIE